MQVRKKRTLAALAQLDRVFGYEPKGQGFESLTPRQNTGIMLAWFPYFVLVFVHKIPRKCLHLPERAPKPYLRLQPYSARLGSDPLRRAKNTRWHSPSGIFCCCITREPPRTVACGGYAGTRAKAETKKRKHRARVWVLIPYAAPKYGNHACMVPVFCFGVCTQDPPQMLAFARACAKTLPSIAAIQRTLGF